MIKNKKAVEFLTGTLAFILLNVLFFAMMLGFLSYIGNDSTFYETVYSKKISSAINSIKPGTELTIYIGELYDLASKNNYLGNVVEFFPSNKTLIVKVSNEGGKIQNYFSEVKSIYINREKRAIIVKT